MPRFDRRSRRKQHPQRVARLGHDRLAIDEVAVAFLLGVALLEPGFHRLVHAAVGREGLVEERRVAVARRRTGELGRKRRSPRAAGPVVVAHVSRRLLEVGGQATPFQGFREQLGRLLTREVHAPELGHGIVAVLNEHRVVEARGPFTAGGRCGALGSCPRDVPRELVEEQSPQRLRGARVAGEHRTFDRFGQVDQGEDRPIEVREVRCERRPLAGGEGPRSRGRAS